MPDTPFLTAVFSDDDNRISYEYTEGMKWMAAILAHEDKKGHTRDNDQFVPTENWVWIGQHYDTAWKDAIEKRLNQIESKSFREKVRSASV